VSDFASELVAICRTFGMVERDAVCCGTVTVQQCVALQTLLESPRELSALAAETGTSPSAMTRLVDGLESKGWVERVRDGSDRRKVEARLTTEGQSEAERLRGLTEQTVSALLAHIPEGKHDLVLEGVKLLRGAVGKLREKGLGCC